MGDDSRSLAIGRASQVHRQMGLSGTCPYRTVRRRQAPHLQAPAWASAN